MIFETIRGNNCGVNSFVFITLPGPSFWGLINPVWPLCTKGRRQSPINIEPDKLLFDRHLRPVLVDKHKVIYRVFLFYSRLPYFSLGVSLYNRGKVGLNIGIKVNRKIESTDSHELGRR